MSDTRKPWEIPISYNSPAEEERQAKARPEPTFEQSVGRAVRPCQERPARKAPRDDNEFPLRDAEGRGAHLDNEPLAYRRGDPDSVLDLPDHLDP